MRSHDDILRFGEFRLDPANRRLMRGDHPIELGGRYLDTLVMLASAPGQLISKERLHEEVWRGVPVTDEALSQAIMALRKALGDDAARPRYIETVPRHGYRFVASLEGAASARPAGRAAGPTLALAARAIMGAATAGLVVGLTYGAVAAQSGAGNAFSLVMVLICVSMLAALVSGLGIGGGIGLAVRGGDERWRAILGGAVGGLVIGGFARLLGIDTLRLLMGNAPDRMAGALEGLAIGTIVGWCFTISARHDLGRRVALAAALGGAAGAALIAGGGTLMAGSLAALVRGFPGADLPMRWADDPSLLILSGAFEGAIFAASVSAAMAARGFRS